ncbi:class I SAM-dependent methyltransferase [Cytobacillus gottheilii]|uniref:class I SAM-dependent methyltransferase n=1 Tax=Cytobacillus gottheilii TaxID=859144 RepID=UPI0009B9A03F|nr:class I SAM-dependent methyltransferase [Cytobacillus gottheilii]
MTYSYHDMLAAFKVGHAHPGGRRLTEKLLNSLPISTSAKVLDAGCGIGETTVYLASKYHCQVFALEHNKQMAELAQQSFHLHSVSIELERGNVENMPYDCEVFDFILAESVTAFTNVKQTLSEYARVLKSDGVLLLNEMTVEDELLDIETEELTQFYGMNSLLTESDWKEAFIEAGFNTVEMIEGKTILQELETYIPAEEDMSPPNITLNEELERIMAIHQELTLQFADVLGYRVFKVTK